MIQMKPVSVKLSWSAFTLTDTSECCRSRLLSSLPKPLTWHFTCLFVEAAVRASISRMKWIKCAWLLNDLNLPCRFNSSHLSFSHRFHPLLTLSTSLVLYSLLFFGFFFYVFILQIGHVRWIKYLNKLCVHFIANQLNGYFFCFPLLLINLPVCGLRISCCCRFSFSTWGLTLAETRE